LFSDALRVQLIAKGIIRPDEWDGIKQNIRYSFTKDNYFTELKDNEILLQRIQMLQQLDPYVGKYYSNEWIRRNVLRQDDEEIKENDEQMEAEKEDQLHYSDHQGMMAGVQQAAMQNYTMANAEPDPEPVQPQQAPKKQG
jgi:hypothetical protein